MSIDAQLLQYYADVARAFPVTAGGPFFNDPPTRRARFRELAAWLSRPERSGLQVTDIDVPLDGRTLRARLYRATPAIPAGAASAATATVPAIAAGAASAASAAPAAPGADAGAARAEGNGRPVAAPSGRAAGAPPLIVYFHGGGWVVGDLDTHDEVAARLALDSGCAVAAIDYRLAPEHPFPAPCDDAFDALFWFAEHRARLGFATNTLGVAGDSAGAHLASGAAHAANARMAALVKAQLLIYPVVSPATTTPSYLRHTDGPGLTRGEMAWYWDQFHPRAIDSDDPRVVLMAAAPERAPAPTVVIVAGSDPLYDEGVEYARFLERHGAQVDLLDAQDMTHGFARLQPISTAARRWQQLAGQKLGRLLGAAV
jgi:acetyl esterase